MNVKTIILTVIALIISFLLVIFDKSPRVNYQLTTDIRKEQAKLVYRVYLGGNSLGLIE